jgi:hypothetical protein
MDRVTDSTWGRSSRARGERSSQRRTRQADEELVFRAPSPRPDDVALVSPGSNLVGGATTWTGRRWACIRHDDLTAQQEETQLDGPLSVLVRQKRDHVTLDRLLHDHGEVVPDRQDDVLRRIYRLVPSPPFL